MPDMHKALADISEIRSQIAAQTTFRGFGSAGLTATGLLAALVAAGQSALPGATEPEAFLAAWVLTAMVSAVILGAEVIRRARQHHAGIADEMLQTAALQFVPVAAAGGGLTLFMPAFAPGAVWLLPGLWQILLATCLLSALRLLPRAVIYAGGWYFLCGFAVLMLASRDQALSPWAMGLPFLVGQGLLAIIVHRAWDAADG